MSITSQMNGVCSCNTKCFDRYAKVLFLRLSKNTLILIKTSCIQTEEQSRKGPLTEALAAN